MATVESPSRFLPSSRPTADPDAIRPFLLSLRPKQWTKSFFVLTSLIFTGHLTHRGDVLRSLAAFALFSLFSGSLYVINDIRDVDRDRLHPVKRHRPLASGRLPLRKAALWTLSLSLLLLPPSFALSSGFGCVLSAYGILMLSYTYFLKRFLLIDVMVISVGFLLRIAAGACVLGEAVTPWAMVCAFFLTLFLGFSKRKADLWLQGEHSKERWVSNGYNPELLRMLLAITASCTILAYSLFTITSGKDVRLVLTVPFVVFGVLQYLRLIMAPAWADSPDELFWKDPPLLINNVLWISSCAWILYGSR